MPKYKIVSNTNVAEFNRQLDNAMSQGYRTEGRLRTPVIQQVTQREVLFLVKYTQMMVK